MKKVIALVGPLASGKDVTKKYLESKYGAQSIKFSKILRDVLERINVPNSRENLQNLSTELRKLFGEDLLAKVIVKDAIDCKSEMVILDGVRRLSDIEHAKKLDGFILISIDANQESRYKRLISRNENEGDAEKTFEEFLADHDREADKEVPIVMQEAKFKIDNEGSFEDLYKKIDEIIASL
jgi:dephospho-CoA kinase